MEPRSQLQSEFQKAYESYSHELFGFCASKVRYREEALDIVHDSFVKYWGVLLQDTDISNPRAYLYSIVRNKIIDHYRAIAIHRVFPLDDELIQTLGDEQDIAKSIDIKLVLKSLNNLKETYREPLVYRYIDGLPVGDIAQMLEMSPNSVTKRITRGVEILRKALKL